MTSQRKQTARRVLGLAGEPQHKREHRGRQCIQHRMAAQMIVCRFVAHQGYKAGKLRGGVFLLCASAGMHDQPWRQIAPHKPVVRGSDGEVSAEQVEPLPPARVLTDHEIEFLAISRRLRSGAAAVVHHMARISGQQQDVAGLKL